MELRNRVKELRARYNLSQGDLGKLADASRQTISLIERGDYSPSILLVLKIAKILKVSVEDIFYLEGVDENEDKKV
ncbi:helix-turn-helix transcriptional regulator [Clostridium estertheticum]|uniref:Transcriptional regulator n=2 Tax=Clostridium estertheticum TaxID=238834 RepID=A0A1J0GES6_9CLOT|nr:helix-turn-helix transcriptional regulator [Clostridium estertheticum]APC39874.1 transcriptional regulator [Clostridium estertheticum subsp. estertheticum]MBU3072646.1 helix-turn-helix transcriptional regulator [Clostridium estertheticum]MBU3162739.1 helix-turn-helix transcriptional regulator [Clostridium estertheticum]MBU3171959.1 helix-turn-helix transcriptional regulator [Clostridium estertheticum]MBU3184951.1 helix-turn-helix transcriptional regulator [Clostridium estertheticum]